MGNRVARTRPDTEIEEMRGMVRNQRRAINSRRGEASTFEALDYARNAVFFEDKLMDSRQEQWEEE